MHTVKLFALIFVILMAGVYVQADQKPSGPPAATNKTADEAKPPLVSVEDQLAIARIRGRLAQDDAKAAQAQVNAAASQKQFEEAKKDSEDGQKELQALIESAKKKLPKPDTGKEWVVTDDGKMGVSFIQQAIAEKPVEPPKTGK
jgi:hypothetical protein